VFKGCEAIPAPNTQAHLLEEVESLKRKLKEYEEAAAKNSTKLAHVVEVERRAAAAEVQRRAFLHSTSFFVSWLTGLEKPVGWSGVRMPYREPPVQERAAELEKELMPDTRALRTLYLDPAIAARFHRLVAENEVSIHARSITK
jgi:hypothetical protein